MFGYAGKILEVDLSDREVLERKTPEKLARAFLGGRGLGAAILYMKTGARIDPFSPSNPLIFLTGPATGTPLSGCARWEAVTKSPLTGTYLCSSAGSFFGSELKFAGFDGIIITGRAKNPAWIFVADGEVKIEDASGIWRKNVDEAEREIRRELGDKKTSIASIGPAGENLVRFASIQVDVAHGGRGGSLGRGGIGAVMGSKNLKAVAVRGHGKIEVADEEGLVEFAKELTRNIQTNELVKNFSRWGTPQFVGPINEAKMWPTKNFQRGAFEFADELRAEKMRETIVKRDTACYACSIASGKYSTIDNGPYKGITIDGPEYETIWSFGAQCGVGRLDAIAAANFWCDVYGLDTISTGNVIGFAMECFERGLLKKEEVGLDLKFGNHEALVPMIEKIARRDGVGDLLAEGVKRAAEKIGRGAERFAIHVKGLEIPAYDPRGAWGMALAYATSCRGGCHLKAWTIGVEILTPKYDRFSTEGKGQLVAELQNVRAVVDSMGVCVFATRCIGVEEMRRILALVTGWNFSAQELVRTGERIYNVERLIAVRDGISRKDDTLPPRLLEESTPELPGKNIGRENLGKMLDDYYQVRGWGENGVPKKEKLIELQIPELLGE
ncbi:MAG: aldehyde ferredoxin oxidoreductase family protein [Candidatus Hadarchaeales archaeon]